MEARTPLAKGAVWIALAVLLLAYSLPFIYLLLTSFKTPFETIAVPPRFLPSQWTLENYSRAFGGSGIVPSFVNSATTAVLTTVITLALAIPAAYGVSRFRIRAGRYFIALALLTRMVPPVVIGVPLASLLPKVGLGDTSIGLAIAHTSIALPLAILLLASFYEALPTELDEAAWIDGCGRLATLIRIVLPVTAGGAAVTALFVFLTSWNEFLFALLLTARRAATTPIAIANFQTHYGLDWGAMTALSAVYSVPVILLTLLLQRHIVSGLSLGAVKG
jgi:multiple sugar transport system permease protein